MQDKKQEKNLVIGKNGRVEILGPDDANEIEIIDKYAKIEKPMGQNLYKFEDNLKKFVQNEHNKEDTHQKVASDNGSVKYSGGENLEVVRKRKP